MGTQIISTEFMRTRSISPFRGIMADEFLDRASAGRLSDIRSAIDKKIDVNIIDQVSQLHFLNCLINNDHILSLVQDSEASLIELIDHMLPTNIFSLSLFSLSLLIIGTEWSFCFDECFYF